MNKIFEIDSNCFPYDFLSFWSDRWFESLSMDGLLFVISGGRGGEDLLGILLCE